MKSLIILNDPPYGTERCYNGLRMAHALLKNDPQGEVTVFLMADSILCAKAGQKTPEGYYNVERMLKRVTTGRGSVFGCKPAPSIKLATNTPMYKRMEDDMDVNCGTILDGEESVQECGQRIFELMLKTASGQPTKSESFDFGGAEFAPWVLGATM